MKHALVTGGAGFIGSHLIDKLLAEGWKVTNIDNFDNFYDRTIKEENIKGHFDYNNYTLIEIDIRDFDALKEKLTGDYDVIVHLAAKAGVRPSIEDPITYQEVNVKGTQNLLELAKNLGVKQFIFGSSSSVYGINPNVPWKEDDHVLMPISPYASTKVSGELMGHVYSHLYGIRFIAVRFFTVYGPRQRPDLAIHKFARKIIEGEPIPIYGDGSSRRDYTYIDDIIRGIRSAMDYDRTIYEVINLGNNHTISLLEMVKALEEALEIKAKLEFLSPQPGDVPQTWADVEKAKEILGFIPNISYKEGIRRFIEWFNNHMNHKKFLV
ncbi:GDP-mannose 4,6-dehydratase [Thermovenabulum sp.]|uniref:GDP-mannose 4,6-dehydratase n=1 Tax=Thermovenabulum sp. TaxID=3100335 RepID=UPI003C7ACE5C